MPVMATQYLQVPKVLPHRKSRSRSKSRPAGLRSRSPPRPAVEPIIKPTLSSFTNTHTMADDDTASHTSKDARAASSSNASGTSRETQGTNYDDLNEDIYALEPCRTPPPPIPLRQRLIGAWKLESYIAYPTPQSPSQRPTYPMTKNVTGFIMYTPDGYMSAHMLIPGQQSFKRGEGEEPQWAEAGKRFFAYGGPYYVTDEGPGREEVLRHTFQVCNLPGWIGDIQIRTHHFEEDGQVLVLGSEEPTEIKGDKRVPVLKWRRARDNSDGVPPPPTPQIKISGPEEL